jgi:hypothetical protein
MVTKAAPPPGAGRIAAARLSTKRSRCEAADTAARPCCGCLKAAARSAATSRGPRPGPESQKTARMQREPTRARNVCSAIARTLDSEPGAARAVGASRARGGAAR